MDYTKYQNISSILLSLPANEQQDYLFKLKQMREWQLQMLENFLDMQKRQVKAGW